MIFFWDAWFLTWVTRIFLFAELPSDVQQIFHCLMDTATPLPARHGTIPNALQPKKRRADEVDFEIEVEFEDDGQSTSQDDSEDIDVIAFDGDKRGSKRGLPHRVP